MKKIIYIALLVLVASCTTKSMFDQSDEQVMAVIDKSPLVSMKNLYEANNLTYIKKDNELFTGKTYIYSGGISAEIHTFYKGINANDLYGTILETAEVDPDDLESYQIYKDAVREYVHKNGANHDALLLLVDMAQKEDLPILLHELKSMGDLEPNAQFPCVRDHCLIALRRITGVNPGLNYSDWENWYIKKYGTKPPIWTPKGK